ncbi:MAG: hypothetical protein IPN34_15315 [Planctomycetes bacterium]|nr:hypothetical protein [Planctomycetota bacterium]
MPARSPSSALALATTSVLVLACAQPPVPAPARASEAAPSAASPAPAPLAGLERLLTGAWRQTAASGTSMLHSWRWGPGQRSLRSTTTGESASGDPWRALTYFYVHPREGDVRTFGLSCYAGGVSEGCFEIAGDEAAGRFELFQQGHHRRMELRWLFTDSDRYRETLLEETSPGRIEELVTWEHAREAAPSSERISMEELLAQPSARWSALRRWIGKGWLVGSCLRDLADPTLAARLRWIPLIDALELQVARVTPDGSAELLWEAMLYHHVGLAKLRCFALSASGEVATGDMRILDEHEVELELEEEREDAKLARRVTFRREKDVMFFSLSGAGGEPQRKVTLQESLGLPWR